jgi:hypothetical protein
MAKKAKEKFHTYSFLIIDAVESECIQTLSHYALSDIRSGQLELQQIGFVQRIAAGSVSTSSSMVCIVSDPNRCEFRHTHSHILFIRSEWKQPDNDSVRWFLNTVLVLQTAKPVIFEKIKI